MEKPAANPTMDDPQEFVPRPVMPPSPKPCDCFNRKNDAVSAAKSSLSVDTAR
jgi:hypothetical protein